MQGTTLATQVLPLVIGLIMFGLGLSLTAEDFKRIARYPKPVFVGLLCQTVILPLGALLLAKAFALSSPLAVGLMILAASPGGATANIFSHLAKGDVALNLTLTAINSVLSAVTLPLIVGFALSHFVASDQGVGFQFGKMIEVFLIILVPVAVGMRLHFKNPEFARRMDRPMKVFSLGFLILIVIAAVVKEWENLRAYASDLIGVMLAFNLMSLGVGYLVPRWIQLPQRQAIAIALEIGVHNSALAMTIALTVLHEYSYAMPAAVYSLIQFFTAGIFAVSVNQKREESA